VLCNVRQRMAQGGARPRIDRAAMQKTATEAKGIDQ
jgi:hypothetical protein